jgi:hypothetical protein
MKKPPGTECEGNSQANGGKRIWPGLKARGPLLKITKDYQGDRGDSLNSVELDHFFIFSLIFLSTWGGWID